MFPYRNGLIITTVNGFTSIFGGFCVFAVLGFMAHETGKPIRDVVSSGKQEPDEHFAILPFHPMPLFASVYYK